MNRQPIIRGHRLPGMTVSRGATSPVTVQRVVQVGNTPASAITTTIGNQTVQGTWRWVPVGTDEVTTLVVGNLNGYYDYLAATYGVAIGEYAADKPNITIDNVNGLRIRNYTANVLTLDLAGNATFEGEITAASGEIGGWTIGAANLTGGDATLDSAGTLTLGTGDDVVVLDAAGATYRLWAGDAVGADAPFSVTKAGVLTAQGATIEGALTATTGALVNLDVSGVLDLVSGGAIQSDGYEAGVAGWRVDYDGSAEFGDITARGTIKTAVFEKGAVAATAGSILVTKSAGKLAADYTVGGTLTIEDPDVGGFLFETNDVVRITAVNTLGNLTTTWITVTRTGTTNVYTTVYASGTNTVTYPAGSVAVDYGVSGDGVLMLTADDDDGPFYSVRTHEGEPWTLTEQVRIGNLNGSFGRSSDLYGIGIGDYSGGNYLSYDPTNGFVMKAAGGGVSIDIAAISLAAETSDVYYLQWLYDGERVGSIHSIYSGNVARLISSATSVGEQQGAENWLLAHDDDNHFRGIYVLQTDSEKYIEFSSDSALMGRWSDAALRVYGGLNIGAASGAGTGDVQFSGDLESYKNSTAYSVYGAHFLVTQLTSTSWNGDAKTSANNGTIDLSAVFGVPAGVKAVLVAMNTTSTVGQVSLALKPDSDASSAPPINVHTIASGYASQGGWVPCDANGDIYFEHSSGDSVSVWIEIWGYAL